MVRTPDHQLDLIYARASSSPGPGSYDSFAPGSEVGRLGGLKQMRFGLPKRSKVSLIPSKKTMPSNGSVISESTEDQQRHYMMTMTPGGPIYDID